MLKNKTILVTGASSGIGQAIAIAAAEQGANVLIHYRNNKSGAEFTQNKVNKFSTGKLIQSDLSHLHEVKNLFQSIKDQNINSIDYLVNNAGEARGGVPDDYEVWAHQLQNILMSQVHVTNEFINYPSTQSIRKIVNISSAYGSTENSNPKLTQYSAAKAAVNSFTINAAKKYAPNILINAIAPGYTWTPPWESLSEVEKHEYQQQNKIQRFIDPSEIAHAVIFLLSNNAITGEILRVDGGLHLADLL